MRSRLAEYLFGQERAKARPQQWLGTLRNLATKGVRSEELQRSGLIEFLEASERGEAAVAGSVLAEAIDFSALRISVISNINEPRNST